MSETMPEAPVEEAPVEETAADYTAAIEHTTALQEWANSAAGDPIADTMIPVLIEWQTAMGGADAAPVADDVEGGTDAPADFSAASVFSAWKSDLNVRREAVGLEPIS